MVVVIVLLEWARHRYETSKKVILLPLSERSEVARAWGMVHDEMTFGKLAYLNSQLWTAWFMLGGERC